MKIVIASDSFKGSASALEVAQAVEKGIQKVIPEAEVVKVPVADGGEGTVDAMVFAGGGELRRRTVTGPLGEPVEAAYGVLPSGTAVIEMAAASGLPLVPRDSLNPLSATTYGTGELIKAALDDGCRAILLGIGGSATNDGGAGMAQALGVALRDADGNELARGGGALGGLKTIDLSGLDPRVGGCSFSVACDVKNPLCGEKGASAIFGPQKGATPEMVRQLDAALAHYAACIETQLGKAVAETPGAGAAGGLGAGLLAFCNAEIRPGIETMLDFISFNELLEGADLVVTGEGRIDGQSVFGKVPVGVAHRAKAAGGIPVVAVVGCVGAGADAVYAEGVDAILPIADGPMALEDSMARSAELLENTGAALMRMLKIGRELKKM
ncbi:MAG: glycerate kinase [Clostridia bacterium]|nr:glycerate kinase [Clostridia bacterium]